MLNLKRFTPCVNDWK